jgi:hypothetical protein
MEGEFRSDFYECFVYSILIQIQIFLAFFGLRWEFRGEDLVLQEWGTLKNHEAPKRIVEGSSPALRI